MKTTKIFCTIVLTALLMFLASWFYSLLTLTVLLLIWRREIKTKIPYKHSFKLIMMAMLVAIFTVMPRYRYNSSDRIQLIYQDEEANPVLPPMSHYIANVLLPEEEIVKFGSWAVRLNLVKAPYVGGKITGQFFSDCNDGKMGNFHRPYSKLNTSGNYMMSGITSQLANMCGLKHTQSVYLIKPNDYDPEKEYPIVFFCHGGMGNWKLYQGLWKDLNDCIVLSVGTDDWDGLYNYNDIKKLFTRQLPFLKNLGYKIDEKQIHLIGISNGGTASNIAYNSFANKFKTITYISTQISQTKRTNSKILLIGGGRDGSSSTMPSAYKRLQQKGAKTAMYWEENETHFIMVNKQDELIDFLNEQMFGED